MTTIRELTSEDTYLPYRRIEMANRYFRTLFLFNMSAHFQTDMKSKFLQDIIDETPEEVNETVRKWADMLKRKGRVKRFIKLIKNKKYA